MVEKKKKIAEPTIERIVLYHRILCRLKKSRKNITSSQEIAALLDIKSSQVRKDLSYFGEIGRRGIGYNVDSLLSHLDKVLASPHVWKVALVGVGKLGTAVISHPDFINSKFDLKALFDVDSEKVGTKINGIPCYHVNEMEKVLREKEIEIIMLAVPDEAAQSCVDTAVKCETLQGVMSFTSVIVKLPKNIIYYTVDIFAVLEKLFFYLKTKEK